MFVFIRVLFFFSLLSKLCIAEQEVCKGLNIASTANSSESSVDIIKMGVPTERWSLNSYSPIISTPHKVLDYFYVINFKHDLNISHIRLSYDQNDTVRSEVLLKEDKKHYYAIEVNYECLVYGGNVIHYELNISIPECGEAVIQWKKLCGNPFAERVGLDVEVKFDNVSYLLAKDGRSLNTGFYFDKDINKFALQVPKSVDSLLFDIYLNNVNMEDRNLIAPRLSSIPQYGYLPDSVWLDQITVDSDQNVLEFNLAGELSHRGTIITTERRQQVLMNLKCKQKKGYSTIEIDISMAHFKDVELFLLKDCGLEYEASYKGLWILLVFIIICAIIFFRGGKKKIPFRDRLTSLYERAKEVRVIKNDPTQDERELKKFSRFEDAEELDFQIHYIKGDNRDEQDISKYGTF